MTAIWWQKIISNDDVTIMPRETSSPVCMSVAADALFWLSPGYKWIKAAEAQQLQNLELVGYLQLHAVHIRTWRLTAAAMQTCEAAHQTQQEAHVKMHCYHAGYFFRQRSHLSFLLSLIFSGLTQGWCFQSSVWSFWVDSHPKAGCLTLQWNAGGNANQ